MQTIFNLGRLSIILTFGLLLHIDGFGQCLIGDKLFKNKQYFTAIQELKKCIDDKKYDTKSIEKLAFCYKILDDYANAAYYYQLLSKRFPKNKEFAEALSEMNYALSNQFLMQELNGTIRNEIGHRHILSKTELIISKPQFNSLNADFSPAIWKGNLIYSTTDLQTKREDKFTGQNYAGLIQIDSLLRKSAFANELTNQFNIGSCSFSQDGNTIYFTANSKKKNKNNQYSLQIYSSQYNNGKWSLPVPFPHANININMAHPTINESGDIFVFASDSLTNYGMELFFITKNGDNSAWSAPKLVFPKGKVGNQVFPGFVDDITLSYSSDHTGTLDILLTQWSKKKWSEGELLPSPWNSSYDDYGLCLFNNSKSAYVTSNRFDKMGNEDIVRFDLKPCPLYRISIIDKSINLRVPDFCFNVEEPGIETLHFSNSNGWTDTIEICNSLLSICANYNGIDIDTTVIFNEEDICKDIELVYKVPVYEWSTQVVEQTTNTPINDIHINILDERDSVIYELVTNEHGLIKCNLLKNKKYRFSINSFGYVPIIEEILHENKDMITSIKRFDKAKPIIIKNILYDYDKWDITQIASLELDKLVKFLQQNANISIELSSHTDSRGNNTYNQKLSQKRADAAKEYLVEHNIMPSRIIAKGYGEEKLINECKNSVQCSESKHHENRRTEILILNDL